jgi:hypothetical protein
MNTLHKIPHEIVQCIFRILFLQNNLVDHQRNTAVYTTILGIFL